MGRRDNIHETPDVTHIHNPDVAHEASDVNVRAILKFTFGLFAGCIVIALLMWLLLNLFEKREQARDDKKPAGPMALSRGSEQERLPPEPRLQAAPGFGVDMGEGKERQDLSLREPQAEYRVLRQQWQQLLDKGEKDPATGAVTMLPIEEAKKKIIEEGLPARAAQDGQQSYEKSVEMPAYSSSGRTVEKRRQ